MQALHSRRGALKVFPRLVFRYSPHHAMFRKCDPDPEETAALLHAIQEVFKGVPHRGVRLHETEVIDHYGSPAARKAARLKDTDRNWQQVRDEWIEEFGGVGGLSFLDGPAFRYYLPAYMSYWLRKGSEPNSLSFYLHPSRFRKFENLFRPEERQVIGSFTAYVQRYYPWCFTNRKEYEAYAEYWTGFCKESGET